MRTRLCVNVLSVNSDEKEEVANDVFSAGFLVKGLLIYIYTHTHERNSLVRRIVEEKKNTKILTIAAVVYVYAATCIMEYLKISEQFYVRHKIYTV